MKEQAEKERFQAFFILQKKDVALQEKDQEIIRPKQMLESKLPCLDTSKITIRWIYAFLHVAI